MNPWMQRRHANDEAEALLSGHGATTALLNVEPVVNELRARYADRPAPAPNTALEQVFAWGLRNNDSRRVPSSPVSPANDRVCWWPRPRRLALGVLAASLVFGSVALARSVAPVRDAITEVIHSVLPDESHRSDRSRPPEPSGPATGVVPEEGTPSVAATGPPAGAMPSTNGGVHAPPATTPIVDPPPVTVPIVGTPTVTAPDLPIDVPGIDLPPVTVPPLDIPPIPTPPIP